MRVPPRRTAKVDSTCKDYLRVQSNPSLCVSLTSQCSRFFRADCVARKRRDDVVVSDEQDSARCGRRKLIGADYLYARRSTFGIVLQDKLSHQGLLLRCVCTETL